MNRIAVIVVVVFAVVVASAAFVFVSNQPTVPDGGAVDTNIADSRPGNPDGGSGS